MANSERDYTEWDLRLIERLAALYALVVQRRQAEEALGESEERFRRLAENAQDVIYRIELRPRPHFTYVSPSAESVFGCTPDELYADLDLLLRLTRDEDRASLQSAFCGKTIAPAVTVRLCRPDGQTVWIESRQVPIHDDTNYVVAFEGIARDITRQKRLEDELVRAQRLEMAGQIAGQVAHDLNNLLAPLVGYPELMKMQLPDDDPLQDLCDTMIEAGQQIGGISANLLALGRRGLLNQQPIDLNRLVRQSVAQLRAAPETFRVAVDLAEPLRPISASAPQILRVVTNLVVNAREAMSDRGTLAIRTSNVVLTEAVGTEAVGQCARVAPGEYVLLEVEDSGCGIPPELKCKVFEPFFTTKTGARRRGSGLGLSIVDSIVSDHHGYVDLESTVGKGTTFRIYLPACQERLEEVRAKAVKSGSEAILVVDDDPIQRDVLARLLCRLGYQVASAESGEEAVAFLRERRADLVVLDMVMDGIDGTETYRQALEVQADLRAIVISGLAEPERVREATEIGVGAFLLKPVAGERLARAVRDELDRGARTASTTGRVTLSEAGGQAALSGHTPAV